MKLLSRPNLRTTIISAGVAAVTALVAAGGPALAQGSAPTTTPPSPVIVAGAKAGPVFLFTASYTTLGTLHLTAGSWTIFAKAEVVGQTVLLHCRLVAGADNDHADPQIDGSTVDSQEVALNVTHVFASAGTAVLSCNSSGVSVAISSIKMTAIKAGTLTKVTL